MLPPFIIEQIRRREHEEDERTRRRQPVAELPVPGDPGRRRHRPNDEEDSERGVVVIDLFG